MHRYKVAIMQQHLNLGYKKLPVVISMLFYHGKGQYPYCLKLIDCVEDTPFAKAHFFDDPACRSQCTAGWGDLSTQNACFLRNCSKTYFYQRSRGYRRSYYKADYEECTKIIQTSQFAYFVVIRIRQYELNKRLLFAFCLWLGIQIPCTLKTSIACLSWRKENRDCDENKKWSSWFSFHISSLPTCF